jgi:hypothetical protein
MKVQAAMTCFIVDTKQKCCKARLKFVKLSNKWYFKDVHSHPDHYVLSRVRSSKPQFGDLSQERQQQLRDLVITKKRMNLITQYS